VDAGAQTDYADVRMTLRPARVAVVFDGDLGGREDGQMRPVVPVISVTSNRTGAPGVPGSSGPLAAASTPGRRFSAWPMRWTLYCNLPTSTTRWTRAVGYNIALPAGDAAPWPAARQVSDPTLVPRLAARRHEFLPYRAP
jgi:hypothetical protein